MKRSAPLQRKTPLKSTGFKRKTNSPFSSLASRATLEHRTAIKSRIKKPTVAEGAKYLAACRGEPCYLRVPGVCRLNPLDETVVPCHSNQGRHGKAGNLKAKKRIHGSGLRAVPRMDRSEPRRHAEAGQVRRVGSGI